MNLESQESCNVKLDQTTEVKVRGRGPGELEIEPPTPHFFLTPAGRLLHSKY